MPPGEAVGGIGKSANDEQYLLWEKTRQNDRCIIAPEAGQSSLRLH